MTVLESEIDYLIRRLREPGALMLDEREIRTRAAELLEDIRDRLRASREPERIAPSFSHTEEDVDRTIEAAS